MHGAKVQKQLPVVQEILYLSALRAFQGIEEVVVEFKVISRRN